MKMILAVLIAVIFLFGCSFAQLEENLDDAKQALADLSGKLDAAEALTAGAMATVDGMQKILDEAKEDQKDDWIGWGAGILAIVLPVAGRRTRRA